MTRVTDQPGIVVHTRPYRESSLLVSVLTLDHGLVSLVGRGVRGGRRGRALQPFTELRLGWSGRSSLGTLAGFEVEKQHWFQGNTLASAFYLTELIIRLLDEREPHPRLFGTFPRILAKYVREDGVLTLPEAIRRMTSLPARVFGMNQRGQIKPGFWADLVMFDQHLVQDLATYDEPKTEPAGIAMVMVNGELGLLDGNHQQAGSGKMLRYRQTAYGES